MSRLLLKQLRLSRPILARIGLGNNISGCLRWRKYSTVTGTSNTAPLASTSEHDGVVIGIHEDGKLTPAGEVVNKHTNGELAARCTLAKAKGKPGDALILVGLSPKYPRVAVAGVGKIGDTTANTAESQFKVRAIARKAAAIGIESLRRRGATKIAVEQFYDWEAASEGSTLALAPRFPLKKVPADDHHATPASAFPFIVGSSTEAAALPPALLANTVPPEWDIGKIYGDAQLFARRLAETPSNYMTPTIFYHKTFEALGSLEHIRIAAYDKSWASERGMGCFLGVAQGSAEPPLFLEIVYDPPAAKEPPNNAPLVALIGKGVTFDTGGISIKPAANMAAMKGDMGGAAAVVAAIGGLAKLRLPVRVVGLCPLAENMPSGTAIKPGDVLRAANGKTVEVDNTDAEGRLLLADALCYAATTWKPDVAVDVATLTGAIDVALGPLFTGVFTADEILWNAIEAAGRHRGERMWRMPLDEEYKSVGGLDGTSVADLRNSAPGRSAGSCVAAAFLKEFVDSNLIKKWAHLDIAATATVRGGKGDGMTGTPARSLMQLVRNLAKC